MKINIDYKRTPEQIAKISNRALTENYLEVAVLRNVNPQEGLDRKSRRIWARIQLKLEDALRINAEEIQLENAEIDFIKEAFKDAKFQSDISKYVVILEDEIDSLKTS